MYTTSGFVYALDSWPEIAERVLDIIQSLRGRIHKAVILDLDNTLWGGVVGDDGLENIQIGDLGIGKAFSEFQAWLKQLKQRGILLAVCSKNYEHVAKQVFEKHPDMVLRLDDIAVFVANWENKVDNIRHIQSVLNIGFDSMVYLDDSPFERAYGEGGDSVADGAGTARGSCRLPGGVAFVESVRDGERVRDRRDPDAAVSGRSAASAASRRHMTPRMRFWRAWGWWRRRGRSTAFHVPRIAQLSQRSNQFNLRTVRYTEQDVERIMRDPGYVTRYFTLEGQQSVEYGLISMVVLRKSEGGLFIENWLMSCRVLKRGMEEFVLNAIMQVARENGSRQVVGEYIPTEKNQLVKRPLREAGFRSRRRRLGLWKTDRYTERDDPLSVSRPRVDRTGATAESTTGA